MRNLLAALRPLRSFQTTFGCLTSCPSPGNLIRPWAAGQPSRSAVSVSRFQLRLMLGRRSVVSRVGSTAAAWSASWSTLAGIMERLHLRV